MISELHYSCFRCLLAICKHFEGHKITHLMQNYLCSWQIRKIDFFSDHCQNSRYLSIIMLSEFMNWRLIFHDFLELNSPPPFPWSCQLVVENDTKPVNKFQRKKFMKFVNWSQKNYEFQLSYKTFKQTKPSKPSKNKTFKLCQSVILKYHETCKAFAGVNC